MLSLWGCSSDVPEATPAPTPVITPTPSPTPTPVPTPASDSTAVRVLDYIPNIFVDLRYAGTNNFTGQVIYDFTVPYRR